MKRQAEERLAAEGAWSDPDWVFSTTAGGRLYPPDITKTFHQLTDEAGLPRIRIQDVRHTHATLLLKAHANIKVVSERLGQQHDRFNDGYLRRLIPGMQRDAARRFGQRLQQALSVNDRDHEEQKPN